ncbi:MAG: aspartate aminotransferase family protein [Candidatus Humimicrobiaceae bacterium]
MVEDKNLEIYKDGEKYLMPTYSRLPVVFTRANMQYLWDAEGNRYTDYIAGYGCLNVGHSNGRVVKAIASQIGKIIQPSNIYYNIPQVELAKKLCVATGFGQKVFFSNSGTEAVEGAIKLARKYSTEKYDEGRYEIISFYNSFHGRTLGALSATAQTKKQKVFEPLLEGFKYADLNDLDSVKAKISDKTCAVIIEPIQGEGGVNPAENKFMSGLKELCQKEDILLIADEIQTGFGRTGKMFACQDYGIDPDILVVAKSLGGGMPIGAIISTEKISSVFGPGSHGSTFGGNAASCAAGCAVIDYIREKNLVARAEKLGNYFQRKLSMLAGKFDIIKEIRGKGLMIGAELTKPIAPDLVKDGLEDKLIINWVSDYTLRFLPPLIINKKNLDTLIKWLNKKFGEIENGK